MSNCYVFFVKTGSESKVCRYLNKKLGNTNQLTFSPKKEVVYRNSGKVVFRLRNMFPGYVFTKTNCPPVEFIHKASILVRRSRQIIRLLGMYTPDLMIMNEKEKNFMLKLCDEQFIIRKSTGLIIGNRIIIKNGPLIGKESIIKHIDRHKRRAEIELTFMGELRRVSVALEIVSKI